MEMFWTNYGQYPAEMNISNPLQFTNIGSKKNWTNNSIQCKRVSQLVSWAREKVQNKELLCLYSLQILIKLKMFNGNRSICNVMSGSEFWVMTKESKMSLEIVCQVNDHESWRIRKKWNSSWSSLVRRRLMEYQENGE